MIQEYVELIDGDNNQKGTLSVVLTGVHLFIKTCDLQISMYVLPQFIMLALKHDTDLHSLWVILTHNYQKLDN